MPKLYVGLRPPKSTPQIRWIHLPLIAPFPLPSSDPEVATAMAQLPLASHILFTSQVAVEYFFDILKENPIPLDSKYFITIGPHTRNCLQSMGPYPSRMITPSTTEGIVNFLDSGQESIPHLFWPHSALSRTLIPETCARIGIPLTHASFYETRFIPPSFKPNFEEIDEIFFTSPSSVEAFLYYFHSFPPHVKISAIGPVTKSAIERTPLKNNYL